jgi:hypothetical protein
MQNKHDIRNQHQQLHPITYIFPSKQKTGKKTSHFSTQDATSCLVFVSKSPSTWLVWNYYLSSSLVLTAWPTGVTLRSMSSLVRKKDPSKTHPESNEVKSWLEVLTSHVLGLFETKTRHDDPSWRSSDLFWRPKNMTECQSSTRSWTSLQSISSWRPD